MQMSQFDGSGQSTNSVSAAAFIRIVFSVQNLFIWPIVGWGTVSLKACRSSSAILH